MASIPAQSVFIRDGAFYHATGLARGPWDMHAQHGGAPAGLLAHCAQQAAGEDFVLARLTFELTRPVPIAPLTVTATASRGRTARRVELVLAHDDAPVGRAVALMRREQPVHVPRVDECLLNPAPTQCRERFEAPGMASGESFHDQAMEIRFARGSSRVAGPAAAWLRLRVPLIAGQPNTPAMRAVAAADFGNGLSWILPADTHVFANTDLSVYLHRAPIGEWIGLDSETIAQPNGVGLASSTLYDTAGRIGVAHQNLLVRAR
ncbi:thioesterase family protein [Salinisphaera sp. T31B1]|uniref:thioesterase family protein n=1 Tax=Salinisphaera sp. T31B1 TaxID=727963 RepID=UPI003341C940